MSKIQCYINTLKRSNKVIILRIVHAIESIYEKNNTKKNKFFEKSNFINFFIRKLFFFNNLIKLIKFLVYITNLRYKL